MQSSASSDNSAENIVKPSVVGEIRERFPIGPKFAAAYLRSWQATRGITAQSLTQIMSLPAPEPMWFEYALSTNWRGAELRAEVAKFTRPWFQRYLDVGCGFGGCMVAFSKLGMEVLGVELDPNRVEFARLNLLDHNIPPQVQVLNILEKGSTKQLGRFDLITCIDVIEHVLDVPLTISTLSKLLNPGGVLVLEIPNKNFIPFVAADGHFSLFGITQLPRDAAIEYHKNLFSFEYDVGDYYELEFYLDLLRANGLNPSVIDTKLHPAHDISSAQEKIGLLKSAHERFVVEALPISAPLRLQIDTCYQSYLNNIEQAFDKNVRANDSATLKAKYLTDFWTIVARKWS